MQDKDQKNEPQDAAKWMGKAVQLAPQDPTYKVNLAAIYVRLQHFDKAVEICRQVLTSDPGHVGALHIQGDALHGLCQFELAVQAYDEALRQSPQSIGLWVNRGNSLQELRQFDAAQDSYTQALSLDNGIFEAYLNRGNVRSEMGMHDLAIHDYQKALSLRTDSNEARANLGHAFAKQQQWQIALPHFEQVNNDIARSETLKCLYQMGAHEALFQKVRQQQNLDRANVRSAAIMAFVSQQLNRSNEHLFCPDPLGFVHLSHLAKHETDFEPLLKDLKQELLSIQCVWNPLRKATQSGFQTPSSLFVQPTGSLVRLEQIIRKEIEVFRQKFEHAPCHMMQGWPRQYGLEGWFVRLHKSGFQQTHIHPQGWISGVIYLQVVPSLDQNEGAIEFGLYGDDLNILNPDYPRLIHQPQQGDLVLFPSSLFHRTIPFNSENERMIVAFDLIPIQSKLCH